MEHARGKPPDVGEGAKLVAEPRRSGRERKKTYMLGLDFVPK